MDVISPENIIWDKPIKFLRYLTIIGSVLSEIGDPGVEFETICVYCLKELRIWLWVELSVTEIVAGKKKIRSKKFKFLFFNWLTDSSHHSSLELLIANQTLITLFRNFINLFEFDFFSKSSIGNKTRLLLEKQGLSTQLKYCLNASLNLMLSWL